jgi:hypothetical protein
LRERVRVRVAQKLPLILTFSPRRVSIFDDIISLII